ncbi:alpha/beta hydrolase family protein [Methylocella sp.]|uniref:alpha/beta hydrolase family protein n=1 Tax=Methylocella sp. TaxID=1978226 RepID=UPI0035B29DB8
MQSLVDLRLDQLFSRFGFLFGAALLALGLIGLVFLLRWSHASRPVLGVSLAVAAAAAILGAALFAPAAGRVGRALQRVVANPGPPAPSGPFPTRALDVLLPPREGAGAPIRVRLFIPAAAPAGEEQSLSCADLGGLRLADPAPARAFQLLVYTPGLLSVATDSASTAAQLASRGYVVAALDDPGHDAPTDPAHPFFDFSSDEAFAQMVARSTAKSQADARRAQEALDRLTACASGAFAERVDFARVGAYGFSFGGSVAATLALLDPRVVAAANLSGFVFGPARDAAQKPYLVLLEDEPLPTQADFASAAAERRIYKTAQAEFLDAQAKRLAAPDAYGFILRGTTHANFNDSIFSRADAKYWPFADPQQAQANVVAYLCAFFGHYLRGEPPGLLTAAPGKEIVALKGRPDWRTWE